MALFFFETNGQTVSFSPPSLLEHICTELCLLLFVLSVVYHHPLLCSPELHYVHLFLSSGSHLIVHLLLSSAQAANLTPVSARAFFSFLIFHLIQTLWLFLFLNHKMGVFPQKSLALCSLGPIRPLTSVQMQMMGSFAVSLRFGLNTAGRTIKSTNWTVWAAEVCGRIKGPLTCYYEMDILSWQFEEGWHLTKRETTNKEWPELWTITESCMYIYSTDDKRMSGTRCAGGTKSHLKNEDYVCVSAALSAGSRRVSISHCRHEAANSKVLCCLEKLPKHFWASGLRHIRGKRGPVIQPTGLSRHP